MTRIHFYTRYNTRTETDKKKVDRDGPANGERILEKRPRVIQISTLPYRDGQTWNNRGRDEHKWKQANKQREIDEKMGFSFNGDQRRTDRWTAAKPWETDRKRQLFSSLNVSQTP